MPKERAYLGFVIQPNKMFFNVVLALYPYLAPAQQASPPEAKGCQDQLVTKNKAGRRYPSAFRELLLRLAQLSPDVHGEIVDDEIHVHRSGSFEHSFAVGRLNSLLDPFVEDPDGWVIAPGHDVIMRDHTSHKFRTVRPDLLGWRKSRGNLEALLSKTPAEEIPDWIAQVASDSTASYDRYYKVPLYAANGVKFLWLILSQEKKLEVFRLSKNRSPMVDYFDANEVAKAAPFLEQELDLKRLWTSNMPKTAQTPGK